VGKEFKHIGLFEGIGGFSLAARWAGWETVAWCEWNEFGQKVLRHHFPEAEGFGDITKTDFTKYANRIDILTGGFPCQPYSLAGKRKGKEDERHLWPEMLRAIREIQPPWVVGENVFGLINWNGGMVFNEVQADLETEGYEVWAYVLPACAVNAPHRRDRVWFVAHSNRNGFERSNSQHEINASKRGFDALNDIEQVFTKNANSNGRTGNERESESSFRELRHTCSGDNERIRADNGEVISTNPNSRRQPGKEHGETESGRITETSVSNYWENFPTQPPICGGDDGLPTGLDGITFPKWRNESIKAYGNAIVPQVAYEIFKAINQMAALADKERGAVFNNFQTEQSNGNEE
jgi:DNA (cytosine-5)-methyltransferase 1